MDPGIFDPAVGPAFDLAVDPVNYWPSYWPNYWPSYTVLAPVLIHLLIQILTQLLHQLLTQLLTRLLTHIWAQLFIHQPYNVAIPSLCRIHTPRDLWRTKRSPRRPILPTLGACSACAWASPWVSFNHLDWTRPTSQRGCQHDWTAQIPLWIQRVFSSATVCTLTALWYFFITVSAAEILYHCLFGLFSPLCNKKKVLRWVNTHSYWLHSTIEYWGAAPCRFCLSIYLFLFYWFAQ